ncbi:hypothetical protein HK099_002177 [Clydaea vesicula]|uniref:Uncharacterized protein n=1 Tax=Clydaea vesicula TaxID=447962 RepID=A0AAD5U7I0_9FUNG|nr:hypothetical protein HK099_002177 [Clydaea vesicula]
MSLLNVRNLVSDTIKKLTEFQLHNNNEADTEDNVNYNSSCDKMLEKMSKVYSSKLSRNKQTVSRIGPRIHSTEASHKSIPLKQTNSSSGLSPISKSAGNSPAVESFDSWNDTWQQEDNSSNNDSVGTPTSFAIDNFSLDTDQDEWTAPTAEVDDPAKLLEREKEKQLRLAAREARQAELKKKRELKKKNNILVATKSSESLQNLSNNSATSSPTSVSSPVKGAEISKNLLTEEDETKKNLEKLIAMKKEEETKSPMLGYNNSFTNTSSPAEPKSPPQVDYFSDMTPTFKAPVVLNVASGTLSNSPSMEFVDAVTDTPFPSRVTYQPEGTEEVSGGWGDDL